MARLSLGQSTGTVAGAQDSKRLVGATPQVSSAAALAGSSIQEPSLKPQAAPVDVYFRPGSPTLGGPVQIPTPPSLPEPSEDLSRLAKSLGGFSQNLQQYGEAYVAFQKQRMSAADTAGRKAAFELQQQYPGQSIAELRDSLYKKAEAGDQQAAAMYQKVQALSPLQLAYANRYVAMANLRQDLDSAAGRFSQIEEVPDGEGGMIPVEQLSPGDPRLQQALQGLLRIPNDPVVWKEFEPLVYAKYTQLTATQTEAHNKYKERTFAVAQSKAIRQALMSPDLNSTQQADLISKTLTDARIALGPEGYRRVVEGLSDQLVNTVVDLATYRDESGQLKISQQHISAYQTRLDEIIQKITAGPNGEKYIDYLGVKGGPVALVESQRKLMELSGALRNDSRSFSTATGTDAGERLIAQYNLAAYANDQVAMNNAVSTIVGQINADPTLDPVAKQSAISTVTGYANTLSAGGSQRIQENFREQASAILNRSDLSGEEKVRRIEALGLQGATATTLSSAMQQAVVQRTREQEPLTQQNADLVKEIVATRKTGLGGQLTQAQQIELSKLRGTLNQELTKIETEGRAKQKTSNQIFDEQQAYLARELARIRGANRSPSNIPSRTNPGPNLNNWYKDVQGTPLTKAERQTLYRAVNAKPLMTDATFMAEIGKIPGGGQLSPAMKALIRGAGYNKKPGQFFRLQAATMGIVIDPSVERILKRLDASPF